jgi:hypothetical protein
VHFERDENELIRTKKNGTIETTFEIVRHTGPVRA